MIEFEYVTYKNFQSAGNTPIRIDLNRSPSTMISGANGSGKSNVLESISFALFGKPLKKVNLGGLINTINKKNLLVEIAFKKQGKSYKIRRGQKPSILEFYIDDELQDQSANSRDYQAKIEYVLGMDYKLFTQIVVLNKEKYVPFMELGAADRRKIVEDILDISVFSYMSDNLKTRLSSLNNTIEDLKYERGKIETKIVGQRRLIAEASSNVDSQVANISASIKVLLNNKNALESDLEGLTDVLRAVSNVETELTDTEKRKREFESIATKFSVNVENLKKTLSFFEDNDNCPTCGQEIAEDTKNTKRHECTSKIDEISSHSSKLAVSYGEVIAKVNDLKTKVRDIQQKEAEVGSLQNQLRNIDREIQNKNNELSKLNQESKVHQYEEELDYLENELVDKTDELNGLMKSKDVYELARSILKDDGIKASIVRDYIEFINNRVNEYLATMEFYINIQLDENFNDSIKAVNREGFVYDNLSTGQKTRVSMAVYLALLEVASLKNSVVTNLLILDEIFEPLDPLGVQLVMKLLKEKFAHKNIFVITQRSEEFADMFRNEIKFRLVDGFTEKV